MQQLKAWENQNELTSGSNPLINADAGKEIKQQERPLRDPIFREKRQEDKDDHEGDPRMRDFRIHAIILP